MRLFDSPLLHGSSCTHLLALSACVCARIATDDVSIHWKFQNKNTKQRRTILPRDAHQPSHTQKNRFGANFIRLVVPSLAQQCIRTIWIEASLHVHLESNWYNYCFWLGFFAIFSLIFSVDKTHRCFSFDSVNCELMRKSTKTPFILK